MTNCKRIDENLEYIDDCQFHIRKLAQSNYLPDHLEEKLNKIAEAICFLADEVETWCEEHQHDDEEDPNFGFNEVMDAEINSMLQAMRVR